MSNETFEEKSLEEIRAEAKEQQLQGDIPEETEITEDEIFAELDDLLLTDEKTIKLEINGKLCPFTIKPLTASDNIKILGSLLKMTTQEIEAVSQRDPNFANKRIQSLSQAEAEKRKLESNIKTCMIGTKSPKLTRERLQKYSKSARGKRFIQELSLAIEDLGGGDITRMFLELES